MTEFVEGPLGREPLFLRAYDLRKSHRLLGYAVMKMSPHLHRMDLPTSERRPFRLISTVYMETMARWAGRLGLPDLNVGLAAYFATTEDAHHAISYTEARFKTDLEDMLGDPTDGQDRYLTTGQIATLLEVSPSAATSWAREGILPSVMSTTETYDISEKGVHDFCQWQQPLMYDPAATVRNL